MNKKLESIDEIECPICETIITDVSIRKICGKCGNADRTRTVHLLYKSLYSITKTRNALLFTQENYLMDSMFESCERSIYLGMNHLDIQNINREDNTYSWLTANHVLEHIENDVIALKEMFRIISEDGCIQLTVPTTGRVHETNDWGFPDKDKMGHYRNYGADFVFKLRSTLPNAHILCVFATDSLSPFTDIVYLITKSQLQSQNIMKLLFKNGYITIPLL